MTGDAVVVVPVLDVEQARECVATMSAEVAERLLLVNNTDESLGADWPGEIWTGPPHNFRRRALPRHNQGISRSMNEAARRCLGGECEAVVWASTSMRFGSDGGARLVEATLASEVGVIGMPGQTHDMGFTRKAFELVGLWDENYWPAYAEDTDFRRRLMLAGAELPLVPTGGTVVRDGMGYDVLRSRNPGRHVINFDALWEYHRRKWGAEPHQEPLYDTPFGDPANGLSWWPPCTVDELIERYGLAR